MAPSRRAVSVERSPVRQSPPTHRRGSCGPVTAMSRFHRRAAGSTICRAESSSLLRCRPTSPVRATNPALPRIQRARKEWSGTVDRKAVGSVAGAIAMVKRQPKIRDAVSFNRMDRLNRGGRAHCDSAKRPNAGGELAAACAPSCRLRTAAHNSSQEIQGSRRPSRVVATVATEERERERERRREHPLRPARGPGGTPSGSAPRWRPR